MTFSKLFVLAVSASTLATASVLGQRHSGTLVKKSEGTVAGTEPNTSYSWNSNGTFAQCPKLLSTDVQTSLAKFDGLFLPYYSATVSPGQSSWSVGALYLSYPEGTFAFDFQYTSVTPNNTATWVNEGTDITNVWDAVRADIVNVWSQNNTFQLIWYDVNKTIDGVSNYAGQFQIHVSTPTFVKGCDTSCGGDCNAIGCTTC